MRERRIWEGEDRTKEKIAQIVYKSCSVQDSILKTMTQKNNKTIPDTKKKKKTTEQLAMLHPWHIKT